MTLLPMKLCEDLLEADWTAWGLADLLHICWYRQISQECVQDQPNFQSWPNRGLYLRCSWVGKTVLVSVELLLLWKVIVQNMSLLAWLHPHRSIFPLQYVIEFPMSSGESNLGFSLHPVMVNIITLAWLSVCNHVLSTQNWNKIMKNQVLYFAEMLV